MGAACGCSESDDSDYVALPSRSTLLEQSLAEEEELEDELRVECEALLTAALNKDWKASIQSIATVRKLLQSDACIPNAKEVFGTLLETMASAAFDRALQSECGSLSRALLLEFYCCLQESEFGFSEDKQKWLSEISAMKEALDAEQCTGFGLLLELELLLAMVSRLAHSKARSKEPVYLALNLLSGVKCAKKLEKQLFKETENLDSGFWLTPALFLLHLRNAENEDGFRMLLGLSARHRSAKDWRLTALLFSSLTHLALHSQNEDWRRTAALSTDDAKPGLKYFAQSDFYESIEDWRIREAIVRSLIQVAHFSEDEDVRDAAVDCLLQIATAERSEKVRAILCAPRKVLAVKIKLLQYTADMELLYRLSDSCLDEEMSELRLNESMALRKSVQQQSDALRRIHFTRASVLVERRKMSDPSLDDSFRESMHQRLEVQSKLLEMAEEKARRQLVDAQKIMVSLKAEMASAKSESDARMEALALVKMKSEENIADLQQMIEQLKADFAMIPGSFTEPSAGELSVSPFAVGDTKSHKALPSIDEDEEEFSFSSPLT